MNIFTRKFSLVAFWSLQVAGLIFVAGFFLLLCGCNTLPAKTEDNTARFIAHPQFRDAVRVAPQLMSDVLNTTTRLEAAAAKK